MIGGFTVLQIKTRLSDMDAWQATLLAQIVYASHLRQNPSVDIYTMAKLDPDNFKLALAIMNYRHTSHWNEAEFNDLANWCLNRLNV
jgi:hypothetical protein